VSALIKKELSSYFSSPIGYIFCALFILANSITFYLYVITTQTAYISPIIAMIYSISMILIPLLTMRLISEEKKQKTDQALLTAPLRIIDIVMGKFLSAFFIYAVCTATLFLYSGVIAYYTIPVWGVAFSSYIGILCYGAFLISIGMFISSLTENQFIAAVISYGVIFMLSTVDAQMATTTDSFSMAVYKYFSVSNHFNSFASGLFSPYDMVFFLSFMALFIFLTIRMIDKKRWS